MEGALVLLVLVLVKVTLLVAVIDIPIWLIRWGLRSATRVVRDTWHESRHDRLAR